MGKDAGGNRAREIAMQVHDLPFRQAVQIFIRKLAI